MTKEEALKAFRSYTIWELMDKFTTDELQEMIDAIVSTPSLPSNLDEAAQKVEDYYDVGEEHGYLYCHRGDIKDAFKAGAEWMAGQGYADTRAAINEYKNWGDGFAKLELGINEDDDFFEDWQEQNEIIVQIRKKQ